MAVKDSLTWWDLTRRIVLYTNRHLQSNRQRSLLPIATIAAGTLLVYIVLTLTAVVKVQMAQFNGTLSASTAIAVGQATVYIAIIALIVGALETAIVMTRSVLSRVREVGIFKATGVSDKVIFSLFVTEALIYGVLGGTLGVVLGWLVAIFIQVVNGTNISSVLEPAWMNLFLAIGLAVVVSAVTAFFPIWRIVRLSAIQTIYYHF